MSIQNINEFRATVDSLDSNLKRWGEGGLTDDELSSLATVERDIRSTQKVIEKLAKENLKESDLIETSKKLVGVIDGIDVLRNKWRIVDYKKLSFFEKIVRFFSEFKIFGGYRYVSVDKPIDVTKAKEKVISGVKDVLMSLAPTIRGEPPAGPFLKNIWGVKCTREETSICIWEKGKEFARHPVTVTEKGIHVSGTTYASWEEAFQAVKTANNIEGSFESVQAARKKALADLTKFTIEKIPSAFEGKWFIQKEGENLFYVKTGEKIPISIGLDGFLQSEGQRAASVPELFSVREEDCLAKVYEKQREESLMALFSIGVEGEYRDGKISLASGGGFKNVPVNGEGKIVVIDRNRACFLVTVTVGRPVEAFPLKIQEDGTYSLPIDIKTFKLGCMTKVFVQNEENKLKAQINDQFEIPVEQVQKKMDIWKTRWREGYRFVDTSKQELSSRVVTAGVETALKWAKDYVATTFVEGVVEDIAQSKQPTGCSVEIFGCNGRKFYPLMVSDNGFIVTISPEKRIQDISLDGLMRQIEEECKVGASENIVAEINEKERKYGETIQELVLVGIPLRDKMGEERVIKERLRLAQEASESVCGEKSVWKTDTPYFGCTWKRNEGSYMFSVKPKNKECIHIFLDVVSEPGNIRLEYPEGVKSVPAKEFRGEIEKLYPGIVFPEVWDKEYRNIEPFLNEVKVLRLGEGDLNSFKEDAQFLGKDAAGAVYADCSGKIGTIVFHLAGIPIPVTINLLECVKDGKLIINKTTRDSIKAYLEVATQKNLIIPEALEKLAEAKNRQVSSLFHPAKGIDEKTWKEVTEALEGENALVWEIVSKPLGSRYQSLFLRIGKENLPINLVKGSQGKAWKIQISDKEFDSIDAILEEKKLKKDDRYETALARKNKKEGLALPLMGHGTRSRVHSYFCDLTLRGEEELFSTMIEMAKDIQKPIAAIYEKDNKYYRATIQAPYQKVQNDEILIHTTDIPYFSIESDKRSGKAVQDLIPKGMIDLVKAVQIKNNRHKGIEALESLLMFGEQKGVTSYVKTIKTHNYFYTLTEEGGKEELFAKMKNSFQESKKPISTIYKEGNKYYVAVVATPDLRVQKREIVIHSDGETEPYFSVEGNPKKLKSVKDLIPPGTIDLEEAEVVKNSRKKKVEELSLLLVGAPKGWRQPKEHHYFCDLTKIETEKFFSRMKQQAQEIQKPLVAIYKDGNKYFRATIEKPYFEVRPKEIVVSADEPYFSIREGQKGNTVQDLIPKGMVDMVEADRIGNRNRELAKKFSIEREPGSLFSAAKTQSFFTPFSSFEEAEEASKVCLPALGNKKLIMIFLDNEGKTCLLTRTKERQDKRYYITEVNNSLLLKRIPDNETFEHASFSDFCRNAAQEYVDLVSFSNIK